jgi:hypothetical protein
VTLLALFGSEPILIFQGPDSQTSETVGVITDVLTEPGIQADRNVQASPDSPRYEVMEANPTNSVGQATLTRNLDSEF